MPSFVVKIQESMGEYEPYTRWRIVEAVNPQYAAEGVIRKDTKPENWQYPIEVYELRDPAVFNVFGNYKVVQTDG